MNEQQKKEWQRKHKPKEGYLMVSDCGVEPGNNDNIPPDGQVGVIINVPSKEKIYSERNLGLVHDIEIEYEGKIRPWQYHEENMLVIGAVPIIS